MAAAFVAILVWFGRVWIPAQEQYLNERNLRALRTIAAQIKAKVDNFDPALDHAIDSIRIEGGSVQLLKKYVRLFSPDLEIVTLDAAHQTGVKVTPGDPPNVRIQRADGRNYLYLGYLHDVEHRPGVPDVSLIARADIDQVAAPYLTRSDFDALLLVDNRGVAIAQQSPAGLELTSVDRLLDRALGAATGTQSGAFDRLRTTTNLAEVTIGASNYMLYAQPVPLSLMHQERDAAQAPEEWTVCGLVRSDRFRAASSTIPTTYWLWLGAGLALIVCAVPLVKLRVLSRRERLRRVDSVAAAAAVFSIMALVTFTALDLHGFGMTVPAAVDDQLQEVTASMAEHVRLEIDAIDKQMTAFEGRGTNGEKLWPQLGYVDDEQRSLTEIRQHFLTSDPIPNIKLESSTGRRPYCEPTWSCRSGVLPELGALGEIDYPFFKMMMWSDSAGWQRIKWSTSAAVTPFINVDDAKLGFNESLKLARRFPGEPNVPAAGVSVLTSPNTGEKVTAFWKALPALDATHGGPKQPDLLGEALVTIPVSLTKPILPRHVQFAVVDRGGRVLFHSDAARSLTENFFQESEENPTLKSLVTSRDSGALRGRYLGRAHRFHVSPLDMKPFGDPQWSLVVFQDAAVGETANLETINLAVSMFGVYSVALIATWAFVGACWPDAVRKWLWPLPAKGPQYRRAATRVAAAGLVCVAAVAWLPPAAFVLVAVVAIAGALAVTFSIVRAGVRETRDAPAAWLADFFRLRASLLFLLAAVPAMVCFHIAFAFHTELVVKRGQSHLASELAARADGIHTQAQRVALCTASDRGTQPCDAVAAMVEHRARKTLWDVHVPVIRDDRAPAARRTTFASTALGAVLRYAYRPYNEIAADLLTTPASWTGHELDGWQPAGDSGNRTFTVAHSGWTFVPAIAPRSVSGASWLIVAVLAGVAYALVRYLLHPLFALDLRPPAQLRAPTDAADDSSLLVVGPPGSRRTERFRRHPRVRIFDVRSLSFADEPIAVVPSPVPVSSAADSVHGMDDHEDDWTESIRLATLHPCTIVAVDHLEHRLGDYTFRRRMLECLESAVYGRGATIWCGAARDPIELLSEFDPPAPDRQRWTRLFEGFRRERIGLEVDQQRAAALRDSLRPHRDCLAPAIQSLIVSECEVAPELLAIGEQLVCRLPIDGTASPMNEATVLDEIGRTAEPFYTAVWSSCSIDERVVLRQLAEEGLVNPNNAAPIVRLLGAGLVRHDGDPAFSIMNKTFRRFVIGAASHEAVSAWEREGVRVPWGTIATTGVTVAFGLAGLLLLTQEQLVDAWMSYVPAFAPAIPTVWKVLASVQKGRIEITA